MADTFFEDSDYALYLDLLADAADRMGVEIWPHFLMPNHLHIIAVPSDIKGLSRTFRYVHRHYTGYINTRLRVIAEFRGHHTNWPLQKHAT